MYSYAPLTFYLIYPQMSEYLLVRSKARIVLVGPADDGMYLTVGQCSGVPPVIRALVLSLRSCARGEIVERLCVEYYERRR